MSTDSPSVLACYLARVEEIVRLPGQRLFQERVLDGSWLDWADAVTGLRRLRPQIIDEVRRLGKSPDDMGVLLDRIDKLCLFLVKLVRPTKSFTDDDGTINIVDLTAPFKAEDLYPRKLDFLAVKEELDRDLVRLRDLATFLQVEPPGGEKGQPDASDCIRPDSPTADWCLLPGRRVRWEGEPVELQKRLWNLLEYLLTHPGYPLQQGVIEDAVWNGEEITSKTFANTFSRLNAALAAISFPWTWRVSDGEVFLD